MAKMVIGTEEVKKIMFGTEEVSSLAIGGETVPVDGSGDYSKKPFTIEALGSGDFYIRSAQIDYSLDGGDTWNTTTGATTLNLNEGDTIQLKKSNKYIASSSILTGNTAITFNVYGNVMSLVYGDNYIGQTSFNGINNVLNGLLKETSVVDASNLILPVTEIDCSNAYYDMFYNCYNLTAAPELPATTLNFQCYANMFYNCYNLTAAPELPATTLVGSCYENMFRMSYAHQNIKLNYLKCLAIDTSASNCLTNWVQWVSSPTGTFVKKAGVEWPTGVNGIPNGWTVVEE